MYPTDLTVAAVVRQSDELLTGMLPLQHNVQLILAIANPV